jgi:prepilin-type processing-associated H-X9-DG protein
VKLNQHASNSQNGAFALVELLVMILVIAVLAGLRLAEMSRAKEKSNRIVCLSNCKQFAMGSAMFTQDDISNAYTGTINYADDDANWLFPNYVSDINTFHCPSTQEIPTNDPVAILPGTHAPGDLESGGQGLHITGVQSSSLNSSGVTLYSDRIHNTTGTMVKSLDENAHGRTNDYGSSYEVSGYLDANFRKTESFVNGYKYVSDQTANRINIRGQVAVISDIWIMYDADDVISGDLHAQYDDYPEIDDNHGASGANIAFADGHASWVKGGQDYDLSHAKGTDQATASHAFLY